MEYVSIPWENHRKNDSDNHGALTVNLALWFVHILAGNAHELAWSYDDLWKEKLTTGACTTSACEISGPELGSQGSEPPQTRGLSGSGLYSRKRRRDSDVCDVPHYSFTGGVESFTTEVRAPLLCLLARPRE